MNFPEFWNSVWLDPQFQALSVPTRLLFYATASQVDQAGWWWPHPQLTPIQIEGIGNLAAALEELNPWIQVHKSGFCSLRGYVAVQAPKGLKLDSGFHRGLHKRLVMHKARELKLGPCTIEGLDSEAGPSSGALEVDPKAEPHAGTPSEPQGNRSPRVQSPKSSAQSSIDKVPSPTGVSEGTAEPQVEPVDDTAGFKSVEDLFATMGLPQFNPPDWVFKALRKAARGHSWARVLSAAGIYVTGQSAEGHSLKDFGGKVALILRSSCSHPHDDRRYWTVSLDGFKYGRKVKRWACGSPGCRHTELADNGREWVPEHVCELEAMHGMAWVATATSPELVEVQDYFECKHCGHQTERVEGVAA